METIKVYYLSHAHHLNQILTGFYLLKNKYKVVFEDHSNDYSFLYKKTACIAEYKGKKIFYDMADGYQNIEVIKYFLNNSDFYFKRSYSDTINKKHSLNNIIPLGLYYDVSFFGNPLNFHKKYGKLRMLLDFVTGNLNSLNFFENKPNYKINNNKILFSVTLWKEDSNLSKEENENRKIINNTRINIIKSLKRYFSNDFYGGLFINETAKKEAPELIIDNRFTNKKNYISLMKKCDICIGSLGLFNSIGGKIGEYVAASRGIVCEKMHYTVPGDFENKKNFYEFETPEECCDTVNYLLNNPDKLYEMKLENEKYYKEYLHPKKLIENTIKEVDKSGE